ncbi:MAG TPA: class I SAM-dependent methyltransferase [Crinalium sp.]
MNYEKLKDDIRNYGKRDLEQRKHWYSPAAEAYNRVRPKYPKAVIDQVGAIAHLSNQSRLLEIGCGPGTATVSFAQFGGPMVGLEPNPDFYRLAQQNCAAYPNVTFHNTSFEEWPLEANAFDAAIAASSFHWISSDVGYPKVANALRDDGYLILLWNKELQPSYKVYQQFSKLYQSHAPSLDRYEDRETQDRIVTGLGQMCVDSGYFQIVAAGQVWSDVTYTADEYLMLLNTYSPYLQLEPANKAALFNGLRHQIETELGNQIQLFHLSAFHVAQKA